MIRGIGPLAVGIAIGAMFRDFILDGVAGLRRRKTPSGRRTTAPGSRVEAGAGGSSLSAREVRLDEMGRPIANVNFETFDAVALTSLSFKSLADCFDDMFADHEALRVAIVNYANDHRGDPTVPKLLTWWTDLGDQLSFLVRKSVLNDPDVIASIELIRHNSEDLTGISKQLQQAAATIQGINRGLSLVGALASLFKR